MQPRRLNRCCAICQERKPWKGGRRFRLRQFREVFVCRECAAENLRLSVIAERQAVERAELMARQQAELDAAARRLIFVANPRRRAA